MKKTPVRKKGKTITLKFDNHDKAPEVLELFKNLKAKLPALEELLERYNSRWDYEDPVYRFYHQSYKLYYLQGSTMEIIKNLQELAPNRPLNEWFLRIVQEGTGKKFKKKDNKNWLPVTRPIVEAFFHARYFLEMAVKYGRELKYPPRLMPSGWAALLYLYNLRHSG